MRKFALVAMATALTLALSGSPATAAGAPSPLPGPDPAPGSTTATISVPIKVTQGSRVVETVIVCVSYTAPEPTYSGSNKMVHWGMGISCSEDGPFLMSFSGWLYTVTGSGDNTQRFEEDHFVGRSGVYLRNHTEGKYLQCLSTTSHKWVAKFTGSVDGYSMTPAVFWSDVWTLPCS